MQPRSRTRYRDPPPPPLGGGRHRRRSPSPRHQRRPPQPQRRSPDRRRYEDIPIPVPDPDPGAADRRSRADILLEAGRLAAHYLVAQGVIPDHLLRAREDPNHATVSRPEAPAPASYGRKRDDNDEDPRWRRGGDWDRSKGEESRRSGWDRRSHSFDERRKYDVDRGARRTRDYEEPKRPPMSRSYSHNDRRASGHPKRSRSRSRSRSRTRTRSYHHGGSRRDSDVRPTSRDLDHTKLPDSAMNPADSEMARKPKVHSSVVVDEVNDSADRPITIEDGEMESEIVGLDHTQDVSEEEEDGEFAEDLSQEEDGEFAEDVSQEDQEFAVAGINDEFSAEMDVTERQPYDVDIHPSESAEEPVHMQSQLNNVEEEMEAGTAPMDASMVQQSADKGGCSEVGNEMEAPQNEVEAGVGNLDRDEQELPSWYRIFDLNVTDTPEGCERPELSGDLPADHICGSVPDLAGQMNQQANYGSPDIQGHDERAGANHLLEYGHDLSKYDLNNLEHAQDDTSNVQGQDEDAGDDHLLEDEHDLNKCDLNHEAGSQVRNLLSSEEIHLNRGMAERDSDNCHLSNEQLLLKHNAYEQRHDDLQMENQQMLVDQGTSEQGLDTYHVSNEQLALSHVTDEQVVNKHQLEPEPVHLAIGVQDSYCYDLNGEQMLLNNVKDSHTKEDTCHLKDRELIVDQAVDGQARVHNMGNGWTVPLINLEDDYIQQPDTRDTEEFLGSISDQETSCFSDNPHTNIQEVSSSITPNFGNSCTGRGAADSQKLSTYGTCHPLSSGNRHERQLPHSLLM